MTESTEQKFASDARLGAKSRWHPDEHVWLSSREKALARVLVALREDFDVLDGADQAAIAAVLTEQAKQTLAMENPAQP